MYRIWFFYMHENQQTWLYCFENYIIIIWQFFVHDHSLMYQTSASEGYEKLTFGWKYSTSSDLIIRSWGNIEEWDKCLEKQMNLHNDLIRAPLYFILLRRHLHQLISQQTCLCHWSPATHKRHYIETKILPVFAFLVWLKPYIKMVINTWMPNRQYRDTC